MADFDLSSLGDGVIAGSDGSVLRALIDANPECIKVVGPDGGLLQMNPAGLRMIEARSFDEVRGASVPSLIAPEHRDDWRANHARVCTGETLSWEYDIVGMNGTRRQLETHAVPIRLSDGSVCQLAVTRDVSARKAAEAALQQANEALEEKIRVRTRELQATRERLGASEQSLALLVDSVTDYAIYMLDPTGRIASWNAGAQRIKGYRAEEVIGQHFSKFYTEEDRKIDLPSRGLRAAAREGRFEAEGWRVRRDGSRFLASVVIDAIHANGQLVGFAKVTRDVTEQRAAEAQLRQAQKMEAIGQFTGGAAHDFNNLLMAILGSLELLQKYLPEDPRAAALLDNAVLGARRGASLTQRMLAFARRQELKHEAVDLPTLVEGMRDLLVRSVGPSVVLDIALPAGLPPVRTDANQLETALLNLAINARDAMTEGGTIAIRAEHQTVDPGHASQLPAGDYIRLSVKDNGIGMDDATLARVTEPFFTTKGVGKGTGLGLSMVDGLTGQSGGKLMLSSRLGEGTTVELWLPVADLETIEAGAGQAPEAVKLGQPVGERVVLVVDDDNLVLMNTAAMLEDLGHRVIEVTSGAQALEALEAEPAIDLVVSDQAMPGMTGAQLIQALRARRPDLQAILATGYAELPSGLEPSVGRLSKPFSQRDLAVALAALG